MATVQIDRLLDTMIKQGGSDLHITVGKPPCIRLHGHLRELKTKVLDAEDTIALMKSIASERAQQELQEQGSCDFGFSYGEEARFRVSVFRQRGNLALVLRMIPSKLMGMEQIGLPDIIKDLCRRPRGLFLVTGPTGSGKTSSLAAMINFINTNLDHHIITVEDPIEYTHNHKKSLVNQREIGNDVPSFAEATRRALRQDPDVILIGEMRDLETIEAAIRAAETGHLVFSTLHTNSAGGTITRIIDAFPVTQQNQIKVQLSASLIAVLSQSLLPTASGTGRIAAFEFLVVTPAIGNLIREGKPMSFIDSAIQTGKKYGMQLLDDHLWEHYSAGKITAEDMLDKARDAGALLDRVHRAGGTVERKEIVD